MAVLAGVGASFLLLGAEFVGITQILVYIGAIVVLFLFGIMLTRAPIGKNLAAHQLELGHPVSVIALLIGGLLELHARSTLPRPAVPADAVPQTTAQVSDSIFGQYLIPFEVVSMLLLAALVGAIVIARRD